MLLVIFALIGCAESEDEYKEPFWVNVGRFSEKIDALIHNSQKHIFMVGDNGVWRSVNNGYSWEQILQSTSIHGGIAINSKEHLFVASHKLNRSIDNGETWEELEIDFYLPFAEFIAISPRDHIFVSGWNSLGFSVDNGNAWTEIDSLLPNSYRISSFAFGSDSTIYAGTTMVNNRTFGVIKCTDTTGTYDNWTQVGFTDSSIYSLAINASGHIFAGTNNGVFRSTNNGDDWTLVGLSGENIYSLALNSNGLILAGAAYSGSGIFLSDDNGESWTAFNTGLTRPVYIRSLVINSNDYAFVGTFDEGIFRSVHPISE